ncbi:MAG: Stp1/IreP family PP2C-type Ser/Thr phosphatase [Acidimicrobiia bacterium]
MTRLRSGAATDVGRVRRNNQDHYLDDEALFAVADGMGGAAGGEEASRTAVAALRATFEADPTADGLADGVRQANRAVWEKARQRPDLRGMGTTMTAVALVEHGAEGEVLAVVNVGDSRVYLLRDGELVQVTDDHSVPEELLRAGRLTPEEAAVHPQRNVLTRALGIEPDVEVDCYPIIPYRGDRLVLASDGLFNEVDHDGIASVARSRTDPQEAADELVRLACEGGGNDNVTVVVVDGVDDDDRSARASAAVAATSRSAPAAAADHDAASAAGGATAGAAARPASAAAPATAAGAGAGAGGSRASAAPPRPAPAGGAAYTPPPPPAVARDRQPRFTLRVAVFVVAVSVVVGAGVGAVAFFARGGYYVGLEDEQIVIFKGRPGGLLWFAPTVEERTGVGVGEVLPSRAADLRDGKEHASLADARRYVDNLEEEAARTTTTTTLPPPTFPAPTTSAPATSFP